MMDDATQKHVDEAADGWRARFRNPGIWPELTRAQQDAMDATIEAAIQGSDPEVYWSEAWAWQQEHNSNIEWGNETPDSIASDGLRLLRAKPVKDLIETLQSNWDSATCEIEKRVELRVPGVPVPVIGYIDIITRDGVPGDFKTTSRMWSDGKSSSELQPLFYLAALSQQGHQVPNWTFRHYVISRGRQPDAKIFEVQHQPGELFWLFEMIKSAWQGIEANIFPMNPSTWKCSPQYCEYWPMCRGRWQ